MRNQRTLTFLFQYYHFKISNEFRTYLISPISCYLRIYMTWVYILWRNIIASIITDVKTEKECRESMIIRYVHCVKLNEKIVAIGNCFADEGWLIKRPVQEENMADVSRKWLSISSLNSLFWICTLDFFLYIRSNRNT